MMDPRTKNELLKKIAERFGVPQGLLSIQEGLGRDPTLLLDGKPMARISKAMNDDFNILTGRAPNRRDPFRHGTNWTTYDDQRLRDGWGSGRSVEAIGVMLGRTNVAITCRMKRLGMLDSDDSQWLTENPSANANAMVESWATRYDQTPETKPQAPKVITAVLTAEGSRATGGKPVGTRVTGTLRPETDDMWAGALDRDGGGLLVPGEFVEIKPGQVAVELLDCQSVREDHKLRVGQVVVGTRRTAEDRCYTDGLNTEFGVFIPSEFRVLTDPEAQEGDDLEDTTGDGGQEPDAVARYWALVRFLDSSLKSKISGRFNDRQDAMRWLRNVYLETCDLEATYSIITEAEHNDFKPETEDVSATDLEPEAHWRLTIQADVMVSPRKVPKVGIDLMSSIEGALRDGVPGFTKVRVQNMTNSEGPR